MRTQITDRITDAGVIAILRGVGVEEAPAVADAVTDGGVTALEVTADTPDVTAAIEAVAERVDDAAVGVGTVLDAETARAAQLAGAEFVVTPTVNREVIRTANRYGTPIAAGAYTPTEAIEAFEAGADFVKVFPAKTGGPAHVAALGGPLSQVPLVPTGGVTADDAGAYVEAGAAAIGVGGAIVDHDAIEAGAYNRIAADARAVVEAVSAARE
ncbi:bifunctional 4-hydroxy-2-oxoglutarate aldolase/2-dehydro-3-deoxy-phosphogluconate aldolase [Halorubrum ezzemoulense]|uniref:bifunctional 4-hydroxy-2-oxoglutarate aldolase/2-dehydro-3-deoxy-phosphogluconate aldolase n=1 Tax=Halorubrum ezzemoulense TaxID=337243 RepID=UPI0023311740|nr:bifunctional 4-hydroxy-2-oxoglutarate aldolase/2-dehydro-3-deoxy-phosphogluconate aldolase [Halorubrum ezzemoulense]MDB9253314.1 bifunctional 4-hydroxy-2-oxoglutarate aldolase/2-dehydro-3-deoxy-phosphogluconate aldolase [Halorubrum ezzemoulense]MDB9256321.1 bifunctional 4-hydroxy-2-oxoglutarate aldolase/2-dehydro-3-deoxy-phosphogluconate aldolase [Halorubrum ezzemoulense]MDB9277631.1 bifunctional 4-hydroxy-2-oxoglutarate aldolase/2-dehydro-3-deoxy-phosphogluconate aldolase [Halorubrum ezzemou